MSYYIRREDLINAFYTATGDGDKVDWCIGVINSIHVSDVVEREDTNMAEFWKEKYHEANDLRIEEHRRKNGKWINANEGKWNTKIEVLKCSVCGEIDYRMYKTANFCPNCGARMFGEF